MAEWHILGWHVLILLHINLEYFLAPSVTYCAASFFAIKMICSLKKNDLLPAKPQQAAQVLTIR
jgi:hypothetical protein